ncbi:hypothetical protein [Streptosporangium sp. CA-115845]|uniref:hypothetical protein n=1 Tax=Streptosporangium sp. CA-115845 TaxID=3240071 RepID=UPI003D94D5A5
MPDAAIKSTGQRITVLEAWAFRTDCDLADIKETLSDLPTIIRREVTNEMAAKEPSTEVADLETELRARMDSMEGKLDLILAKLN